MSSITITIPAEVLPSITLSHNTQQTTTISHSCHICNFNTTTTLNSFVRGFIKGAFVYVVRQAEREECFSFRNGIESALHLIYSFLSIHLPPLIVDRPVFDVFVQDFKVMTKRDKGRETVKPTEKNVTFNKIKRSTVQEKRERIIAKMRKYEYYTPVLQQQYDFLYKDHSTFTSLPLPLHEAPLYVTLEVDVVTIPRLPQDTFIICFEVPFSFTMRDLRSTVHATHPDLFPKEIAVRLTYMSQQVVEEEKLVSSLAKTTQETIVMSVSRVSSSVTITSSEFEGTFFFTNNSFSTYEYLVSSLMNMISDQKSIKEKVGLRAVLMKHSGEVVNESETLRKSGAEQGNHMMYRVRQFTEEDVEKVAVFFNPRSVAATLYTHQDGTVLTRQSILLRCKCMGNNISTAHTHSSYHTSADTHSSFSSSSSSSSYSCFNSFTNHAPHVSNRIGQASGKALNKLWSCACLQSWTPFQDWQYRTYVICYMCFIVPAMHNNEQSRTTHVSPTHQIAKKGTMWSNPEFININSDGSDVVTCGKCEQVIMVHIPSSVQDPRSFLDETDPTQLAYVKPLKQNMKEQRARMMIGLSGHHRSEVESHIDEVEEALVRAVKSPFADESCLKMLALVDVYGRALSQIKSNKELPICDTDMSADIIHLAKYIACQQNQVTHNSTLPQSFACCVGVYLYMAARYKGVCITICDIVNLERVITPTEQIKYKFEKREYLMNVVSVARLKSRLLKVMRSIDNEVRLVNPFPFQSKFIPSSFLNSSTSVKQKPPSYSSSSNSFHIPPCTIGAYLQAIGPLKFESTSRLLETILLRLDQLKKTKRKKSVSEFEVSESDPEKKKIVIRGYAACVMQEAVSSENGVRNTGNVTSLMALSRDVEPFLAGLCCYYLKSEGNYSQEICGLAASGKVRILANKPVATKTIGEIGKMFSLFDKDEPTPKKRKLEEMEASSSSSSSCSGNAQREEYFDQHNNIDVEVVLKRMGKAQRKQKKVEDQEREDDEREIKIAASVLNNDEQQPEEIDEDGISWFG